MRYIQYLVATVALILATACVTSEVDNTPIISTGNNGELQVVGRVTQYSDCDVATRSKKEGDEPKVTSMGLALFPIENGTIGNCLYYDFKEGGSIVFIVDRHDEVFGSYENKAFAMYIFANMQGANGFPTTSDDGIGKSLADFKQCAYTVPLDVESVPVTGFPMMGSLGDYVSSNDGDGKTLILKPSTSTDNPDALPMVDGTKTDNLEIPLKSMYAKFTFTISSKPDQEIVGNKAPRFDLTGYTIHNVPTTVDADSTTNDDADVTADSDSYTISGKYAQGATTATFDFYLPERWLTPTNELDSVLPTELKKATYDKTVDDDQNGYRDEDERYHQRFKNKLPGDDQKATYITIEGKYLDHQGYTYDVSYNIYLGGNNYDNFDIIRNTHYNNAVAIRGITASSDMANNENAISIDWRVNVEHSTPLVIGFRREALLDAHFEVRPLRLRLVGDYDEGTSATVSILNEDGTTSSAIPTWIRLEASGTDASTHITSGVSAGKRKYFTADLVTTTLSGGTSVTVSNLTETNQAVWIYVDENTTTESRAAIVRVSYQGVDKDYKIVQNGLYKVVVTDSDTNEQRTYYIEQYEEYLYNYDAEDSYGQTKDEGMVWGLDGVQLSSEHKSFTNNEDNSDWKTYVSNNTLPTYDFYIAKHDGTFATVAGATKIHRYAGQHFTEDIVKKSNDGVKALTMADTPSGAVEYCYNRNKRDPETGAVVDVKWYLPSADELEDFIVAAYSDFKEFQNKYYWTSQPAYIRNVYYYEYHNGLTYYNTYPFVVYDDNTGYARATKVLYENGKYTYAQSGLNEKPDPLVTFVDDGDINFGYFYQMYRWKNKDKTYTPTFGQSEFGGTVNGTQYYGEEFDEKLQGTSTGNRYHVHLGHLYDMTQEGYHLRTKSNRVRCVRKINSSTDGESVLLYKISDTPATTTTLDKSGNTLYVMKNTAYDTYLTTSNTNVEASSSAVDINSLVIIKGSLIKSVAKDQYFYRKDNSEVSLSDSATNYTITPTNNNQFTISSSEALLWWTTTYYLKQTGNTTVSMENSDSGNIYWYFYKVEIE